MADTLIRDNKDYGSVGDFLKDVVKEGSELSVDKILATKKSDYTADTSDLEHKIDELVYKLYGLTEEEIAIVEGF